MPILNYLFHSTSYRVGDAAALGQALSTQKKRRRKGKVNLSVLIYTPIALHGCVAKRGCKGRRESGPLILRAAPTAR